MKAPSVLYPVALAILVWAGTASSEVHLNGSICSVDSDYAMTLAARQIDFRNSGTGRFVSLLADGRITVDNRELPLGAADRERVMRIERGMRELVPEVKKFALDVVSVVFEAVGHASTVFAANSQDARASAERIARTADELRESISLRDSWDPQSEGQIDRIVEGVVGSLIGEVVGNVTAQAIKVALSGDEKAVAELEARASAIEKNVDKVIGKRAKELESRADALCSRVKELDAIEAQITARMPDGKPIDLVRVKR